MELSNNPTRSNESSIEVTFTPADFEALKSRDLSHSTCVVFDVLRATSSMITALGNGAAAITPVATIPEALEIHRQRPDILLAGERDGLRITSELTGSIDFHLGNSPREFTAERVSDRQIVMTTTNGTRALRACLTAQRVLVSSFLNLRATAEAILAQSPAELIIVCSGTFEETAYEDSLGAGALCALLWDAYRYGKVSDSAAMALRLYEAVQNDLEAALGQARNGKRLLSRKELAEDVGYCSQVNILDLIAVLDKTGLVKRENDKRGSERQEVR